MGVDEPRAKNKNFIAMSRNIREGIEGCRTGCEYFPICGSSYVSNRYFEYGDFSGSETFSCHMMRKVPTDITFGRIAAMSIREGDTQG